MLAWPFGDKLKRARRRMKRIVVKKGLARKMIPKPGKARDKTPPPTPKLLEGGHWDQEQWHHARAAGGDSDWWLAHADMVGKEKLLVALATRGIPADPSSRRWLLVDLIRKWATSYLPPEARAVKDAETNWLAEVEALGGVYTCGMGSKGQLGHGDLQGRAALTPVARLCGRGVYRVAAGFDSYRAMAVSTSGFAYTWGGGEGCALGQEIAESMIMTQLRTEMEEAKKAGDDSYSDVDVDLGFGSARSSDEALLGADMQEVRGKPFDDGTLGPPKLWDPEVYAAEQATLRGVDGDDWEWASRKVKVGNKRRPWEPKFFDLSRFWGPGWGPAYTRPMPLKMEGFRGAGAAPVDPVVKLAIGKGHAMCATERGKLYTWGENNENAQLGLAQIQGAVRVRYKPQAEPLLNPTLGSNRVTKRVVVDASGGSAHSAAVASDGTLYTWGSSVRGRLGLGVESTLRLGVGEGVGRVYPAPTVLGVGVMLGRVVTQVACGTMHTVCVADHKVFAWGDGYGGRLGNGSNLSVVVPSPMLVDGLKHTYAVQVAAAMWHSFALVRTTSSLSDDERSLGSLSGDEPGPEFASVQYPSLEEASLPPWRRHLMYFPPSVEGRVYAWGTGTDGQLGIGEATESTVPVPVPYLPRGVSYITSSQFHSAALTSKGSVYTWGRGAGGSLGRPLPGGVQNDRLPDRVSLRDSTGRKLRAAHVACGRNFTVVAAMSRVATAIVDNFWETVRAAPGSVFESTYQMPLAVDLPCASVPEAAVLDGTASVHQSMRNVAHLFAPGSSVPAPSLDSLYGEESYGVMSDNLLQQSTVDSMHSLMGGDAGFSTTTSDEFSSLDDEDEAGRFDMEDNFDAMSATSSVLDGGSEFRPEGYDDAARERRARKQAREEGNPTVKATVLGGAPAAAPVPGQAELSPERRPKRSSIISKLTEGVEPSANVKREARAYRRASQDIWSMLEYDELGLLTTIEKRVEGTRKAVWWQKIALTQPICYEARMQTLSQHTLKPLCASCVRCPGYELHDDNITLCKCGHSKSEHQASIGLRSTYQKMLEKLLFDVNCGWLYATKTQDDAAAFSTTMTKLVRGFQERLRTYALAKEAYRKKWHPIAEQFYYEIKEGFLRGTGQWTKPVVLKFLAPPREDLPMRTPELRRADEVARRQAEHAHIQQAVFIAEKALSRKVRRELKVMEEPPKSQVYYQVEDLITATKREWAEVIPERMWAAMGRTLFNFLDLDADGVLQRDDFGQLFRHLKIEADTRQVSACIDAMGYLRRDMYALRLHPVDQQVYTGFNVASHMQPKPKGGLKEDALYRQVFANVPGAQFEPAAPSNILARFFKSVARRVVCNRGGPPPETSHGPIRDPMYWKLPCPSGVDLLSFLAWVAARPPLPLSLRRRLRMANFRLRLQQRFKWYRNRKGRPKAHDKVRVSLGEEFRADEYIAASAKVAARAQLRRGARRARDTAAAGAGAPAGFSDLAAAAARPAEATVEEYNPEMERVVAVFEAVSGRSVTKRLGCRIHAKHLGHLMTALEIPLAPTELQQALLKLCKRKNARQRVRIPPNARTVRGLMKTVDTLRTTDREARGKSPDLVHAPGSPVRKRPPEHMTKGQRRRLREKQERKKRRRARQRQRLRARRAGNAAGAGLSPNDLSESPLHSTDSESDSSGLDSDERRKKQEAKQAEADRTAAAAAAAAGNKLMGGRDHELLDPKNRNGVWHRSFDFATFYKWYVRDSTAYTFRLRRPLEVLRRKVVIEKVFDSQLLAIRPGGEHMIRRHVISVMRKDVIPVQREVFRSQNPPLTFCGKCGRGFGLRRDKKAHQKSGLCVLQDYGTVPDAYLVRGDGGFVRGQRLKDDGDTASEDSVTSLSDI